MPRSLLVDKFLERSGQPDLDAFFYAMYREELTCDDLQPMAPLVFDAATAAALGNFEYKLLVNDLVQVKLDRAKAGIYKFKGQGSVGGEIAVEAELMCTMRRVG